MTLEATLGSGSPATETGSLREHPPPQDAEHRNYHPSRDVGRPDVQAFYGALAGQRANRGVFITTSTFTQQAVEFAGSVERIVLVDGTKLAELMIEHEVGVASRAMRIPKTDSDYFEE